LRNSWWRKPGFFAILEFVAEFLGVTRQAVSKWENGTADPSTSNLLALAKLYGVSAEELLSQVKSDKTADHP
jgi:transcriptional regulator with XRE-family HTH domain